MEATLGVNCGTCKRKVSIHASVMEATSVEFVPRAYEMVSIHASVMEATSPTLQWFIQQRVSIHASVMEATRVPGMPSAADRFRSTPP